MNVWRLIVKEIAHRKVSFILGVVSVLVASACVVGELMLLRSHDVRTDQLIEKQKADAQAKLAEKRKATQDRLEELDAELKASMAKLQDDIRKSMLKLGFNIYILHKDVDMNDVYERGYPAKYMPEEYVSRLANSKAITIAHLLPSLRERVRWPEQADRTITLIGVRGEVPFIHRNAKKPLLHAVKPKSIVLGYELHRGADVKPGDTVVLKGDMFTVGKCHAARGGEDDRTAWINLPEAQELLDKPGKINEIKAIKCHCAGVGLAKIRAELAQALPDTQVHEEGTKVLARAEARDKAAEAARNTKAVAAAKLKEELVAAAASEKEELERAIGERADLREGREALGALLLPLVLIGAVVWIGYLAFTNARDRAPEVGVLRALGVKSSVITTLFLGKAVLMGLVGAVLGYAAGAGVGRVTGEAAVNAVDPVLFLLVIVLAPALASLASWVPAMMAAQRDPASVLG